MLYPKKLHKDESNTMNSQDIIIALKNLGSPSKAQHLQRYFKTGPGEYAEGDIFWGIPVPDIRKIASAYKNIHVHELEKLIQSPIHEVRMCALLIMIFQAKTYPKEMYDIYSAHTHSIKNWDLVDVSAQMLVGDFLVHNWERRIAIISTFAFIKKGNPEHTMNLALMFLHDAHDLIQKAVGWMLREVGKRCSQELLEDFLKDYAITMPRTTLRYALEHFPQEKRLYFLNLKK
jgi:3-methyladenine DNA glycosylase AlkD